MTSPTTKSPRRLCRVAIACLFALACTIPGRADGADRFDLSVWLARARTRVLVIEFYATHCAPCMKAVPQWKELHNRYRGQGLRLGVVSVQDQQLSRAALEP